MNAEQSIPVDVSGVLADYFRCPGIPVDMSIAQAVSSAPLFFHVGDEFMGYGKVARGTTSRGHFENLSNCIVTSEHKCLLPFDPCEVIDNLRLEEYTKSLSSSRRGSQWIRDLYYALRPFMPVHFRKHLQRRHLRGWESKPFPKWPMDRTADRIHEWLLAMAMHATGIHEVPIIWFWPQGWKACAIVTHDVETAKGLNFTGRLMDLDDSSGIKSSFQIVPEGRYEVPESRLEEIRNRGFEINVHDLNHDGRLFTSEKYFFSRINSINEYGREFRASGFRSGALYRNEQWMKGLEFEYDMSIPNVAHLDPQAGGCCTVMPYFIGDLLELPVTTVQDYSLFHVLRQYSIDLWQRQAELIVKANGLISTIVHPDYLLEKRAQDVYRKFLAYLARLRSASGVWVTTPKQVNDWWRCRAKMHLVRKEGEYRIQGPGSERAQIVVARLDGDRIIYDMTAVPDGRCNMASMSLDLQPN